MSTDCASVLPAVYPVPRRWTRYKVDVPVRAILYKPDKTLIREGRGTEVSEGGMCLQAGLELSTGDLISIEFTPPYSGDPIRVQGVVRNRTGYRYGLEFISESASEQEQVTRLKESLRIFAAR